MLSRKACETEDEFQWFYAHPCEVFSYRRDGSGNHNFFHTGVASLAFNGSQKREHGHRFVLKLRYN